MTTADTPDIVETDVAMSDSPNPLDALRAALEKAQAAEMAFWASGSDATERVQDAAWSVVYTALAAVDSEITRLTADCARKDAALEPFARLATRTIYLRDDEPVWLHTTKGTFGQPPEHDIAARHFRAAAAARGEGSGR